MRQKSVPVKEPAAQVVKNVRRATRRHFSAEDKIRIVLEGLPGEGSIAELCRREGIVQNLYYLPFPKIPFARIRAMRGNQGSIRRDA
jgi:transposase